MPTLQAAFDELLEPLLSSCREVYGERLVAVVVFGSVGRGTPGPESDLDLLIVADPLPQGRVARAGEFGAVEAAMAPQLRSLRQRGVSTYLSPVLKTPAEMHQGSPLFLDLIEDARVLYDPAGVFAAAMDRLRQRLVELGARRVWRGNAWYWDLKPDYQPGEVFGL